ncbi:hypothetical protein L1987_25352 [Smallanthus sonchifolius]|uniref:Uncharacterized protein n=1 Tax=Smallanthus sonchifolius TaxID=185202 RepID=A0ACB9IPE7_9ASTR|nr:hypothetical protein L1987_25352 [Smallanthus sonchifolius]
MENAGGHIDDASFITDHELSAEAVDTDKTVDMAHNNKYTELKSTEVNVQMRRSFSWDRAFFTSDGFLDAEELSNMIEGGEGDDVKQQLQKIEEIENMEVKFFQEIESSIQKATGKKDSKAKKVRAAPKASSSSSTPIKTVSVQPTRSSPLSGGSSGCQRNKVKSPARRTTGSKTGKARADSPCKTKSKVAPVNTNARVSRTPPASPVSSGPSSSTFAANQRSKRGSSVPRRSSVNSEKQAAVDARRNDEWKTSKPAVRLIPKTQSSISLKIKPPPVISHPSPGLTNFSSSSTDQKSKSMGNKGSTVPHRSKSTLKNRPASQTQTPDQNRKQPAGSRPRPRSPNSSQTRKLSAPKTVAAVNTGSKPISQKTSTPKRPSRKQSSAKAKSSSSSSRGAENIILVSPEVMDMKGKLNALKMEINMQKKDRCKETKMSHDKSGKGESSSINRMKNQTRLRM